MKDSSHNPSNPKTLEMNDVADTAMWVATYRAEETERKDALFRDPLATLLTEDLGQSIATYTQGSRYTAWSVVIRTYIIDRFITNLLSEGVDTVLNLGAGLDTRPYRLPVSPDLRWIEVDFPKIIDYKNEKLKTAKPLCRLERLAMDLSLEEERNRFFETISNESKRVLILTEGVVPYLSNEDARSLADALFAQKNFAYWITEYYSPEILEFLRTPKRLMQMKNAPFLFYPKDWFLFFKESGWNEFKTEYFGIESEKVGRTPPTPGWLKNETDQKKIDSVKKYLGYSIYKK